MSNSPYIPSNFSFPQTQQTQQQQQQQPPPPPANRANHQSKASSSKRHSHRRSLSVSTRRESLDVMLLPAAAEKQFVKEEKEKEISSQEGRKRALEALEGRKRSPVLSNGPTGWGEKVMIPDLSDDSIDIEQDGTLCFPSFSAGSGSPLIGGSSSGSSNPSSNSSTRSGLTKRDSFGKLLPASVHLSLPSSSSSSLSLQFSPASSLLSPSSPAFSSSNFDSPAGSVSPWFAGAEAGALGEIMEEEEDEEDEDAMAKEKKTVQQSQPSPQALSQPQSVLPPRLGGRLNGSSPRFSSTGSFGGGRFSSNQTFGDQSNKIEDEKKRFQGFTFAKPRSEATVSSFSQPSQTPPAVIIAAPPSPSQSAPLVPILPLTGPAPTPLSENARFRGFSFPKGPVVSSASTKPPRSPVAELIEEFEVCLPDSEEEEKTPNPSTNKFQPAPVPSMTRSFSTPSVPESIDTPPRQTKRALRPLTLTSPPTNLPLPTSSSSISLKGSNLRPLSLSLAASPSVPGGFASLRDSPRHLGGSVSSVSSGGSSMSPSESHSKHVGLGWGRSKPLSMSLSSSTTSDRSHLIGSPSSVNGSLSFQSNFSSPPYSGTRGSDNKRKGSLSYAARFESNGSSSSLVAEETESPNESGAGRKIGPRIPTADSDPFFFSLIEEQPGDDRCEEDGRQLLEAKREQDREEEGEEEEEKADEEPSLLDIVESERDSLKEDVEGWKERCRVLEEKLKDEKRIAGVERDLARERIRKLGDRLAALDGASSSAPCANKNTTIEEHLAAQTRLINEMRDQVFALASSLARSEEARKSAEEALIEERNLQERRVAEGIDEDRRNRHSGSSDRSSSSFSRFSFNGGASSRVGSVISSASTTPDVAEPAEDTLDPWKTSVWGAPKGEMVDLVDFGVIPLPRPLESLVEEEEEEDVETQQHQTFSSSFDESDDNVALGFDLDDNLDSMGGYDNDAPANFHYHSEGIEEEDEEEVPTPVPPIGYASTYSPPSMLTPFDPPLPVKMAANPVELTSMPPSSPVVSSPPPPVVSPAPIPHIRHHSLVRTWKMPNGPINTLLPDENSFLTESSFEQDMEDDEDIKPFGTWVVPDSPYPDGDISQFSSSSFASSLYIPPIVSSAMSSPSSAGGYNDPPSAMLSPASFSSSPRRPGSISSPSAATSTPTRPPKFVHKNQKSQSYRSFTSPNRATPPISRSATYHNSFPSTSSFGSNLNTSSESPSRFSLTGFAGALGSYVFPLNRSASGSLIAPVAGTCSIVPPVEDDGSVSGQWVLKQHNPHSDSLSLEPQVWSIPRSQSQLRLDQSTSSSVAATTGLNSSVRSNISVGSGSGLKRELSTKKKRPLAYVDPKNQPKPFAAPLSAIDFRNTVCGDCAGHVYEL
ncbi:hypothetical protein [Phaffia rhodozyma]|uniref:Uncharacterized protein n=1 Tax=Phaffia rhodozyma TaxID=264483 RepID=A0A0F7SXY7_PHARH|nr:hypothetical protein [Phaffia rhodozyma]